MKKKAYFTDYNLLLLVLVVPIQAQRTFVNFFHKLLFWAMSSTLFHLFWSSLNIVFLYVSFGLPCFLFPWMLFFSRKLNVWLLILFEVFLSTWPRNVNLLLLIIELNGLVFALFNNSSFVTCSDHLIFNMLRRQWFWNVLRRFSIDLLLFQVSAP